jgi:hypothetical protein
VTIPFGYWQPTSLSNTTSLSLLFAGIDLPQNSGRVPLTGDREKEYKSAREGARKVAGKPSNKCKDFLSHLGIKNLKDVLGAINKQRAFDGMASTLSVEEAGLAEQGQGGLLTVADAFAAAKEDRFILYAQTAMHGGKATRNDVYFSDLPITADTIMHEAIHSLTGLDDDELAKAAGVTSVPKGSGSSAEFNKKLIANCFSGG